MIALIVYAVFVVAKFYPHFVRGLFSGRPSRNWKDHTSKVNDGRVDNIMGSVRPSPFISRNPCPTCGGVLNNYPAHVSTATGNPVVCDPPLHRATTSVSEEEEEEVLVVTLESAEDEEGMDSVGGVDLDQLDAIINDATSLIDNHSTDSDTGDAVAAKSQLMAVIASDELLTSTDFARQLASTLDQEVPTPAFSGLDALQSIAA